MPDNNIKNKNTYYAIGDIHGRLDLLKNITTLIIKDIKLNNISSPILVFLGDYIDRGPESKKVIEFLLEIKQKFKCIFLMGNHEDLLLKFIEDPQKLAVLIINGGIETLTSYGITKEQMQSCQKDPENKKNNQFIHNLFLKLAPHSHIKFFQNELKLYYETENHIFVHAGIRSGINLNKQTKQDLLWIREPFLNESIKENTDNKPLKLIIHGHSITSAPDIHNHRIGIDTGAYHSNKLTAIVLNKHKKHYFLNT